MLASRITRNITVFLITLSIIWLGLSYRPLSENIHLWFGYSIDHPASLYNESIILAQAGQYSDAHALLEGLDVPWHQSEVYELYGDVLYLSSGTLDDIKKLYTLAYDTVPSDRLRQKISLLENPPPFPESSDTASWDTNIESPRTDFGSGTDISQTLDTLEKNAHEKSKYLYPPNWLPRPENEQLSDIRRFLDEGVERVDW